MPKAGHFVPNNYYSPSYAFISDYIAGKKLACHNPEDNCSVAQKRCDAMNNCNGNGSCNLVTGQCECNDDYKFADCSKKWMNMTANYEVDISLKGPMWFTMAYAGEKSSTLYLTPNVTSDIYILKSAQGDPNNFVYDMSFLNVTGNTTFNADNLGLTSANGYSVAVYVNAVDEPANELLYGSMNIFLSEGAAGLAMGLSALVALLSTVF